jgi:hypothetical protein
VKLVDLAQPLDVPPDRIAVTSDRSEGIALVSALATPESRSPEVRLKVSFGFVA